MSDPVDDAALDWVIRLRDPAFEGWEAFETWLSADPRHAPRYHALAAADAEMDALFAPRQPVPVLVERLPRIRPMANRRAWLGGAVAAALVAGVGVSVWPSAGLPATIETQRGETRIVALADGTTMTLNGGTRVTIDRERPRFASVERGEAYFEVVHDAARPFEVRVGSATLVDLGTAFDVVRDGQRTEVAVSEGLVVYNPKAEAVRLPAGRRIEAIDGSPEVRVGDIDPRRVAGWREGRLVYDGAPLGQVAADLSRSLNRPLSVAPVLAATPFRGTLQLDGGDAAVVERLAALTGTQAIHRGDGWRLAPVS